MFTKLEDKKVLIKTKLGYKVLDLYVRNSNNQVHAKNGQYFIALMNSNLTSNANITWQEIDVPEVYKGNCLVYTQNEESTESTDNPETDKKSKK